MSTKSQLLAGYAVYTDAAEFGATAASNAPGSTPSLIVITESSAACGAGIGAVTGVASATTAHVGC